jgi:type I restriction enzyme S subunit
MVDAEGRTTVGDLLVSQGGDIKTGPFGTKLKAAQYTSDGVPVVSVGEVDYGRLVVHEDTPRVNATVTDRMPEYLLREGDIVFGRKGAVDRSARVGADQDGWFLGSDGIRLRLPSTCDAKFIAYQFQTVAHREWMLQHAAGSTMPSLNEGIIRRIPIIVPRLSEQRAIAEVLGSLDDKIEQNRRTAAKLEELARATFRAWFVDFVPVHAKAAGATSYPGLTPAAFEALPSAFADSPLGPIPEGWEVNTLGALCVVGRGSSPRPINNFMGGTIPWLKIADATAANGPFLYATKEFVTEAGASKSVPVVPGDLILSNSASCGIPIFVGLEGCIHDGWLHFAHLQRISKGFLYHWLQWKAAHLIQVADGSVQRNLNTKLIRELPIVVPPVDVHEAFAEINDSLFNLINAAGHESRHLAALRDYLLPRLLSGAVRVPIGS